MDSLHVQEEGATLVQSTASRRDSPRSAANEDPREDQWRQVEDAIVRRIRAEAHGGVRNLEIQADARRVRLRGRCSSYYCKQLAQHAALAVIAETTSAAANLFGCDVEVVSEIEVW